MSFEMEENGRQGMDIRDLTDIHNRHSWMPFTQMKLSGTPVVVEKGDGATLIAKGGQRILDGIGSWWVSIHGHNHPHIMEEIRKQTDQLDHVIYSGLVHEGALRLSERLSNSTGHSLPRVFFSDNGSTAVEIALKMAFQYNVNLGRGAKTKFITVDGGYHGDTIGAMSVGARSVFHEMYEPLMYPTLRVRQPVLPFRSYGVDGEQEEYLRNALSDLEQTLQKNAGETAALILEPLIQGASAGMNMYPPLYLKRARELCDEHDVFLIADEVFTGFGRTGTLYAFQQAGVWPDLMALSKGLTGGTLPLAVTLATEKIYDGFYSDDRTKTMFHGHSMTANPLGVAAANAAMDLFDEGQPLKDVARIQGGHGIHLNSIRKGKLAEHIKEVRFLGSVAVIELKNGEYTSQFGWDFMERVIRKGVLLRPLGSSLYICPPYVMNNEELSRVYGVAEETLLEMV